MAWDFIKKADVLVEVEVEDNEAMHIYPPLPDEDKEALISKIQSVTGVLSPDARALIKAMAHPGVVEETVRYFTALDGSKRCLKYEKPWSCIREAEARYENVRYGWLGSTGIGMDEHWCENCLKKVRGE